MKARTSQHSGPTIEVLTVQSTLYYQTTENKTFQTGSCLIQVVNNA